MPLNPEDNPAMAADLDILSQVRVDIVTLKIQRRVDTDEPEGWDWPDILQLLPPERVEVVSCETDPQIYLVGEAGEWATEPVPVVPMQVELETAQANAGTGEHPWDYGYAQVPEAKFKPYEPSTPHVLLPGQEFAMRAFQGDGWRKVVAQPGDTVWLLDTVTGHDYWRVYAAKTAYGDCYVLSET